MVSDDEQIGEKTLLQSCVRIVPERRTRVNQTGQSHLTGNRRPFVPSIVCNRSLCLGSWLVPRDEGHKSVSCHSVENFGQGGAETLKR
jgi:hypothetical protein